MDEDGPNGSPYEMLTRHDQSGTKRDMHDVTVRAEVVRYRSLAADLVYLEGRLMELERQWGEMSSKKLGCICRLEMANVLARLETQRGNFLDIKG
jgi:hypothetical protein